MGELASGQSLGLVTKGGKLQVATWGPGEHNALGKTASRGQHLFLPLGKPTVLSEHSSPGAVFS